MISRKLLNVFMRISNTDGAVDTAARHALRRDGGWSELKHERLPKLDSLFAFLRARSWNLVLVEPDGIQRTLELLTGVEPWQHAADLVSAHFLSGPRAFGGGLQPEAAEITQFHDIALGQFLGDNGQEGFDGGNKIRFGQGGSIGRDSSQFAQGQATAGLDRWVELLGRIRVGRIAALDYIVLYRHFYLLPF
jgi:hypothetical protein